LKAKPPSRPPQSRPCRCCGWVADAGVTQGGKPGRGRPVRLAAPFGPGSVGQRRGWRRRLWVRGGGGPLDSVAARPPALPAAGSDPGARGLAGAREGGKKFLHCCALFGYDIISAKSRASVMLAEAAPLPGISGNIKIKPDRDFFSGLLNSVDI
jgi:hypothetical protein